MKKLVIVALLVVGMTGFAQEKKGRSERNQIQQMTPEQRNQLQLKKMTLNLDLNASQQEEFSKIISDQSTKKEARRTERRTALSGPKKQLTSEEVFAIKSQMLDEQIVIKDKIKIILSPEQFKKWNDMKEKKQHRMNKKIAHHKSRKPVILGNKK